MGLKSWLFCVALLSSSWAVRAESIYTFNLNAFTYGGQTYAASEFMVGVANAVPSTPEPLETNSVYDGLVIATLSPQGIGEYEFELGAFNDSTPDPESIFPRGPAGTIVGFVTPWIIDFTGKNGPVTTSGDFVVNVANGCLTSSCSSFVNYVDVQGTISVESVTEPGTALLMAAGLVGIGFALSRRRRPARLGTAAQRSR